MDLKNLGAHTLKNDFIGSRRQYGGFSGGREKKYGGDMGEYNKECSICNGFWRIFEGQQAFLRAKIEPHYW